MIRGRDWRVADRPSLGLVNSLLTSLALCLLSLLAELLVDFHEWLKLETTRTVEPTPCVKQDTRATVPLLLLLKFWVLFSNENSTYVQLP